MPGLVNGANNDNDNKRNDEFESPEAKRARLQFDAEAATAAAKSIEEDLCKELFGGGEVEVMTRICLACRKQSDNCKWNSYEVPLSEPEIHIFMLNLSIVPLPF